MWHLLLVSVPVLWLLLCAVAVAVCAVAAEGDRTLVVAEAGSATCGGRRRRGARAAGARARHALR